MNRCDVGEEFIEAEISGNIVRVYEGCEIFMDHGIPSVRIRAAIEAERVEKQNCDNCKNKIDGQFQTECYECKRYWADLWEAK